VRVIERNKLVSFAEVTLGGPPESGADSIRSQTCVGSNGFGHACSTALTGKDGTEAVFLMMPDVKTILATVTSDGRTRTCDAVAKAGDLEIDWGRCGGLAAVEQPPPPCTEGVRNAVSRALNGTTIPPKIVAAQVTVSFSVRQHKVRVTSAEPKNDLAALAPSRLDGLQIDGAVKGSLLDCDDRVPWQAR
jgi:hypothetical protein